MGYQEDYNQTLFLQAYGNAKPLKQNDEYQRYFTYECGITNPRAYHKQLIADGFLIPSSTAETLKGYKVAELKDLCDALGIVKTGKKQDIIERLVQNVDSDLLKNYTDKEQCYSLSEKGAHFLSQHKDYIELHRNTVWGISLAEYEREKNITGENDFFKIALGILEKKLTSTNTDGFRNIYHSIAQIYMQTGDMAVALKNLLYVLFFDVNWSPNQSIISNLAPSDDITDYYRFSGFAPGLIKDISNLRGYYKDQMVDEIYRTYSNLNPCLCDKNLFSQLVQEIFNTPKINEEYYAKIFKENFSKFIVEKTRTGTKQTEPNIAPASNAGCLATIIIIVIFFILYIIIF